MTMTEALATVRYVLDAKGEKTDVLVPLPLWKAFLVSWNQLIELLENQEDQATVQEWLRKRATGEVEMIPLEELEKELIVNDLLPG